MNARRYRIDLSYDGTNYAGWQIQPNALTVQEVLEKNLLTLTKQPTKVHGSGRTDQGVHARRQTAHFDLQRDFPITAIRKGLNGLLPPDIRILRVRRVPGDFHARRSAVEKEYRYFIHCAEVLPPCLRLYRAHVRRALHVAAMQEAAHRLEGRHDFAAFTANPRRHVESTVRTVSECSVRKNGARIQIVARGEGFLYRMVRSLAGCLIRVGEGAVLPAEATRILKSGTRTAEVPTAPPQGLFLWNVKYDCGIVGTNADSDPSITAGK
jgi:tRNA pseudouridine38-40 synthase